MNLSNLQKIISEKESDLARFREAAAEAAHHQEEEERAHMLDMLRAMELEMESAREESELAMQHAISQIESDAAANIECAKRDMEGMISQKEEEIFKAARSKMEEEWSIREDCIREEMQSILMAELEDQQEKLSSHYKSALNEKDKVICDQEETMRCQASELEAEHRRQLDDMKQQIDLLAEEIWNDACEKCGVAAHEEISHNLAVANEQIKARDEQMEMLLEERAGLQEQLNAKEDLLQEIMSDANKLESASLDAHERHKKELAKINDEAAKRAMENDELRNFAHEMESENNLLRRELAKCESDYDALETRLSERIETIDKFGIENQRFQSRIREAEAREKLLERQLLDLKNENKDLIMNSEMLKKRACELNNELEKKNHDLDDAMTQISTLKQERREYTKETETRMKELLTETLDSIKTGSMSRSEPVVVHLGGGWTNTENTSNIPGGSERLTSECNNLRSNVLQLQRDNFRLESELMNMERREHSKGKPNEESELEQECNRLRMIISMMRKEMETVASTTDPEKPPLPSHLVLEQQLLQSRSYLDILLQKRHSSSHGMGYRDDEVAFLRIKYQDLHRTADELREENEKLHTMCNHSQVNENEWQRDREKELIKQLEQATEEIEALWNENENEKLVKLSNEYKLRLSCAEHLKTYPAPQHVKNQTNECEQAMLDAILSDQSRSFESESHDNFEVACIGQKHRPSKTAYGTRPTTASDRTTLSQKQSFQRLAKTVSRKKKEIAVEQKRIRNWNTKDPTTNPYL